VVRNAAFHHLNNFGAVTIKDGIKRLVNNHPDFAASRLRVNQD
jgi:iron complex transport system substrate-binding protein